jgi:hypothetical protein
VIGRGGRTTAPACSTPPNRLQAAESILHFRLPERTLTGARISGFLVRMTANVTATISNLRIDNQMVAFTMSVDGDPDGFASTTMEVYDAAGSERQRSDLGKMQVGQTWSAQLDLPHGLEDGDYGVWITALAQNAAGELGTMAQQGVSFLVGRGHVYPSTEAADKRTFTTPPKISGLRLEGTWVVFNMTNSEQFDIEAYHQMYVGRENMNDQQHFHGQELVRAGATQQAHYLLPDGLPDGTYYVGVSVQTEGSDFMEPELMYVRVDGNVITPAP